MLDSCGGGNDPAHDPEMIRQIAEVTLKTLSLNCSANGVCEFHTGLYLIALMGAGMEKALKKYEGGTGTVAMAAEMITTLDNASSTLLEETAKWNATPTAPWFRK